MLMGNDISQLNGAMFQLQLRLPKPKEDELLGSRFGVFEDPLECDHQVNHDTQEYRSDVSVPCARCSRYLDPQARLSGQKSPEHFPQLPLLILKGKHLPSSL